MSRANAWNTSRIRKLSESRRAQMPFSLLAVLLLVLSSTSIALVYGIEVQDRTRPIPAETLEQMVTALDEAADNVARLAQAAAIETVGDATDLNETWVRERFAQALNTSLRSNYPSINGEITTEVTSSLDLRFLRASLVESYVLYGQEMTSWDGASVPAYFVIEGNFTVNVTSPHGHLTRPVEMDQEVYVPLPLLMYRLDRLSRAADPRGELEAIVRYELSALAQHRVLSGYGAEAKIGPRSTEAILTEEDVVRAINLALVLEELKYFGDAGESGDPRMDAQVSGINGPLDPADLFLSTYDEGGIDLAPLVAQTIYSRADALVLRWLDYFHIIDLINLGEDVLEWGWQTLTGTIDFLTGGDSDQSHMIDYITQAMADQGVQQYDYRWFCYNVPDDVFELPRTSMGFLDDNGDLITHVYGGTYSLDFQSVDLFASPAWGELSHRYRSETHAVAESMKGFVKAIATGIASQCSLPIIELELDPSDGRDFLQEIDDQVRAALRDRSSWIGPAIERASEVAKARDGLAQAVMDFVDRQWMELLKMNRSVYYAAEALSWDMAYELNGTGDFSPAAIASAQQSIHSVLLNEYGDQRKSIDAAFERRAREVINKLNFGLSQKMQGGNLITDLIASGISNIPGLGTIVTAAILDTLNSIREGLGAQGGSIMVPVSSQGLVLNLADGQQRTEPIIVSSSSLQLSADDAIGSVDVSIKQPWEYDRRNTSYPNRHVTELMEVTSTPYLTQWGVEYHGSIVISVRSGEGGVMSAPCSATISLDGSFSLIAFGGWGLQGVDYQPTSTLQSDVRDLLLKVWDFLCSCANAVGGLVGKAFGFFCQLISDMLAYATRPLEVLNQLLSEALETLKETSASLLGTLVKALADATVQALGGTTIHLSVLGLTMAVIIGPTDSALVSAEDRIRVDLTMSVPGASITSSVRVLKLADGEHTIAGTVSIGGDDWSADITLDPLTKVFEHQIEVRGYAQGHILEIVAPEVERVQKASFTLSDVPFISQALKSIPTPVPGTKFHIDGGLQMSFNILDRRTVAINEVELNPLGKDASREWVELFNPSDQAIDVTGWSLVTSRGHQRTEMLSGTIPAHGYLVHWFTGQALDNGEVKGFPLQESVALLDSCGRRVDSAPWLKDLADDGRTWQRTYDGSSRWELRAGSQGETNGFVLLSEVDVNGLVGLMEECFSDAFDRFLGEGMDISTLDDIIKDALIHIRDRILDMVEATVCSVVLFIELGLDDLTGSAGGGLRASLVYDGKAVRDCLEWLMDAVGEVLRDPLNPLAAGLRAEVPIDTLADHVFVEVGAYISIGTPDIISQIAKLKVTATAVIKVSLRTLGLFSGNGDWELGFGILVSGTQGLALGRSGLSGEECYDVWVMRGSLRPA